MKNIIYLLTLVTFVSCGEIKREVDAINKNDEGLEHLDKGEYQLAISSFKEAIKDNKLSNNTKAQILRNIAQTYYEMMENDSSLHYSELAAKCYPKDSYEYLVNFADVKLMEGDVNTAINMLERAVKKKPNQLAANNSLGIIYLGDYGIEYLNPEKALPYNLKAFEINNDRITEDVLGRNYIKLKDFKNARFHYSKLHKEYPEMEVITYQLGVVEFLDGNEKKADNYFDQVIKKNSEYSYAIELFKEENK